MGSEVGSLQSQINYGSFFVLLATPLVTIPKLIDK